MTHPGGRPRKFDRSYIANRLMTWCREASSLNINAFVSLPDIGISMKRFLQFCYDDKEFQELYDEAKAFIAINREEANSLDELSDSAYNKHLHVYDYAYVHANHDEKYFDRDIDIYKMDHAHKLKRQENDQISGQNAILISELVKAKIIINP
jgi:hypothetical protein